MVAFVGEEFGERGGHAEAGGVAGVDAGDERLDEALERLAAQAARGERGDAFVGAGGG